MKQKTLLQSYSAPWTAIMPLNLDHGVMASSVETHATIQEVEEEQEYEW